MISDVMFEAWYDIDRYLGTPVFSDCYGGKLRRMIEKVRDEMMYIQGILDTPPGVPCQPKIEAMPLIAKHREIRILAFQVLDYMKFRAEQEGAKHDLEVEDYHEMIYKGTATIFGVDIETGKLVRDTQNPVAFQAWRTRFDKTA